MRLTTTGFRSRYAAIRHHHRALTQTLQPAAGMLGKQTGNDDDDDDVGTTISLPESFVSPPPRHSAIGHLLHRWTTKKGPQRR